MCAHVRALLHANQHPCPPASSSPCVQVTVPLGIRKVPQRLWQSFTIAPIQLG
jgi:hypothetical protein